MAAIAQPKNTYSDTTVQKRAIADVIDIIDPREVPGVAFFGLDNPATKFGILNWPSTKLEWIQDTLAPMTDTLAATLGSTVTSMQVTTGAQFKVGDHILIDAEHFWIGTVSTNTLTSATRAWGGTQATHASAATVYLLGSARIENSEADYDRALTDIGTNYNYTQILQDDLQISRTAEKISQYGIPGEWEYQASKKLPEMLRLMNMELYYGQRKSGSATAARAFGGLDTFITDNTANLSGAALTQKDLEDRIQAIWADGGMPDTIICNAWVKRKLSSFFGAPVRTERTETTGGVVIDNILTEFGQFDILLDRYCPSSKLYIVQKEYIGFVPYEPFFWEDLAKTSDGRKGQVVGEYTFVVKNDKAHGYIYSISTSS